MYFGLLIFCSDKSLIMFLPSADGSLLDKKNITILAKDKWRMKTSTRYTEKNAFLRF